MADDINNNMLFDLVENENKLDLFGFDDMHSEKFSADPATGLDIFSEEVYNELDKQTHSSGEALGILKELERSPDLYNDVKENAEKHGVDANLLVSFGFQAGFNNKFGADGIYDSGYDSDLPIPPRGKDGEFIDFYGGRVSEVSESSSIPGREFKHGRTIPTGGEVWDSLGENLAYAERTTKRLLETEYSIDFENYPQNKKNMHTLLLLNSDERNYESIIREFGQEFMDNPGFHSKLENMYSDEPGAVDVKKLFGPLQDMDMMAGSSEVIRNLNIFDTEISGVESRGDAYKVLSPHLKRVDAEGQSTNLSDIFPYEEWSEKNEDIHKKRNIDIATKKERGSDIDYDEYGQQLRDRFYRDKRIERGQ